MTCWPINKRCPAGCTGAQKFSCCLRWWLWCSSCLGCRVELSSCRLLLCLTHTYIHVVCLYVCGYVCTVSFYVWMFDKLFCISPLARWQIMGISLEDLSKAATRRKVFTGNEKFALLDFRKKRKNYLKTPRFIN